MSFLLEDETQETLAEALAFIDTFAQEEETAIETSSSSSSEASWSDHSAAGGSLYVELRIPKTASPPPSPSPSQPCSSSNNSSSSNTRALVASPGSTSGTDSSSSSSSNGVTSDEQLKKLRARAANTRAVHRYRKRTKTEILTLREQAEQLGARLVELRARSATAAPTANAAAPSRQLATTSITQSQVAIELSKRQASEALNRRLREALVKQRKVSDALESVFKKQTATPNLGFVLDMEKLREPPAAAAHSDAQSGVIAELYQYLEETVYTGTPAVSALLARSGVDCAFNNTLIKHDGTVGKVFEFLSNTPVAGAREQLSAKLWMILTFPIGANEAAEDPFANVRMCCTAAGAAPGAGQFAMQLDCDLGDLRASSVAAIRTFVEPHRTVLVYAAVVTVPGTTLRFRESAWLILSDGARAGCSVAPTLFQTVYRLHAEPPSKRTDGSSETSASETSASTDNVVAAALSGAQSASELHDAVLTKKGERMRGFLVMIQNRLLNGLRDLRLDSLLPPCIQIACGA